VFFQPWRQLVGMAGAQCHLVAIFDKSVGQCPGDITGSEYSDLHGFLLIVSFFSVIPNVFEIPQSLPSFGMTGR
jgi:hypothetical protein